MRHYPNLRMASQDLTAEYLHTQDCVVIVTDHKSFDYAALLDEADVIVDTRNAIKQPHPNVFKLGAPRAPSEGQKVAIV
jgi:UDP-N-acetyl-D-glucosamine dehydrogenase